MRFRANSLFLVGVVLLVGCGTEQQPAQEPSGGTSTSGTGGMNVPEPLALTGDQEAGQQVFETVCWTCHGESGRGNGPAVESGSVPRPPDLTSGQYASMSAADLQARFASLSAADSAHPHMRVVRSLLTEETFNQALTYVPVLGYPGEIEGAAVGGRETYQFRCAACHGETGQGDGPAAGILATPPADFTTDTLIAARDFEGLFTRIQDGGAGVHGSSMPPWGVMMSDEEIWDLVAYIASTFQDVEFTPPSE